MRKTLVLTSLEERWTRRYLIQTYKTANGLESIDWYSGLQLVSDSRTRAATSHSKRLKREVFPSTASNDFVISLTSGASFSSTR